MEVVTCRRQSSDYLRIVASWDDVAREIETLVFLGKRFAP
jgi:hypothetical protein